MAVKVAFVSSRAFPFSPPARPRLPPTLRSAHVSLNFSSFSTTHTVTPPLSPQLRAICTAHLLIRRVAYSVTKLTTPSAPSNHGGQYRTRPNSGGAACRKAHAGQRLPSSESDFAYKTNNLPLYAGMIPKRFPHPSSPIAKAHRPHVPICDSREMYCIAAQTSRVIHGTFHTSTMPSSTPAHLTLSFHT